MLDNNTAAESRIEQIVPRLILALQAARLGVWEFNVAENRLIWDERMYELFGASREQNPSPAEALLGGLHPEDRVIYEEATRHALSGAGSFALEFRVLWPDGSLHYLKSYAEVMPDLDGKPRTMIGANYDISEQKEAEFALRSSANRYRLLTESMQDVIWTLDPETMRFTYISPSIAKLIGFTSEEVNNMPWENGFAPEDAAQTRAAIQRRLADHAEGRLQMGRYYTQELRQKSQNGELVWTEVVSSYGINPETGRLEIRGITRNINERKRAEEKMQRQLTEIEVLYEIGMAVSRLQEPRAICQKALDILAQKMRWHHATIRQYLPAENALVLLALSEPGLDEVSQIERYNQLNQAIGRPGEGLSGWVVANGQPVVCRQVAEDARYRSTYPGIQSGVYVPIKTVEQILGVIAVESEEANAFDQQDERLLATIANQAAIAIENSALYAQVRQKLHEQKLAETRLQASQARYRAIFYGASEGIAVINAATRQVGYANPIICQMFGCSEKEFLQLTIADLHPAKQEPEFWARIEPQGENEEEAVQARCCRADGTEFYAKINTTQIFIENAPYILAFFSDISEQVQANELLKIRLKLGDYSAKHSLKELLQKIIDEAEVLTQSKVGFLHFVTENLVSLQSWSSQTQSDYCRMEKFAEHYELTRAGIWADCVQEKRTLVFNHYPEAPGAVGLPEGHAALTRLVTVPVIRSGEVKAILGVGNKYKEYDPYDIKALEQLADSAWDSIARKRAEDELHLALASLEQRVIERTAELQESEARLRQSRDALSTANAALEKAAHLKDEFLASTSHELRTPLTGILGLSEALHTQTYGALNDKQLKAIQNIESSGQHLLEMINDILDLSKIEAGKLDLQNEFCSLSEICQESLQITRTMANQKHQSISFSINPVTINLTTDPRRLKQMLVNLMSNAVKFMPEGGNLGMDVAGSPMKKQVRITVWDEGIGIDPDDLPYLFQPFVQLDNSLKRQYPGSGLGLALVKRMAALLKGDLEVESTPGKGSRFSIILPWHAHDTQPLRYESIPNLAIHTALSIETNEVEAEHLTRTMRQLRIKNKIHPDVQSAVEMAALNQPDIIFMELHYVGVLGFDLLKSLKADGRTAHIPVVMMSVEERREEAVRLGAIGFLVKPFTVKDLRETLERISSAILPRSVISETRMEMDKPLVFLVDDNEVVLDAMADYLEAQHYRVEKSTSAFYLLEKAPLIHPDLIILDIQMPDIDGLETTRRIRSHHDPRLASTPVVAVTALAMPGDRERCLQAGMTDYLSKPIRLADLALRVHQILLQQKG